MLLLADGEWEPAADTGEGSKRDQSQEKRDVGASRGFVTLPARCCETQRETYRHSHQGSISLCASETQELSPHQQLVHPRLAGRPPELASHWVTALAHSPLLSA